MHVLDLDAAVVSNQSPDRRKSNPDGDVDAVRSGGILPRLDARRAWRWYHDPKVSGSNGGLTLNVVEAAGTHIKAEAEFEEAKSFRQLTGGTLVLRGLETTPVECAAPALTVAMCRNGQTGLCCRTRSRQTKNVHDDPGEVTAPVLDAKVAVRAEDAFRRVEPAHRIRKLRPRMVHDPRVQRRRTSRCHRGEYIENRRSAITSSEV